MAENLMLGAKVRTLRRREKLTQAQLAERLGVSASYLNLIENNRRPVTANVLLKLAKEFDIDLASFGSTEDARLVSELREAFSDPMFDDSGVTPQDLTELARSQPGVARAVLTLYKGYRSTRESLAGFSEAVTAHGPSLATRGSPTEDVNDFLQQHHNHFPEIEQAAEQLWRDAELSFEDVYTGLIAHLQRAYGIEVRVVEAAEGQPMRRYDEAKRRITLSEVLPPRTRRFQLAHQVGLITQSELFSRLALDDDIYDEGAISMVRVVLANYFAACLLMPYEPFHEAAEENRYDIELLAHRYRASFEQVCHRLTTLQRPGNEGIPLHFIRIDVAGNISKRFSASGIRMPRFSGACPRWNVHSAFLTPGMIRLQLSRMTDGQAYFCIARTVQRASGGYNMPHTVHSIAIGCELSHAKRMVYSDGVDLTQVDAATPVGVTCRTCDQMQCEQRVFPPMQYPLSIDENTRGRSFFAPTSRRGRQLKKR